MTTKRTRRTKYTIDFIKGEFAKNGDKLLSKAYVGIKQRLVYVCHGCKDEQTTCWNNYSRGFRCRKCFIKRQSGKGSPLRLTRLSLREKIYNMAELCRILCVNYSDFRTLTLDGLLPQGSQKLGSKLYYTKSDIEKIRGMLEIK